MYVAEANDGSFFLSPFPSYFSCSPTLELYFAFSLFKCRSDKYFILFLFTRSSRLYLPQNSHFSSHMGLAKLEQKNVSIALHERRTKVVQKVLVKCIYFTFLRGRFSWRSAAQPFLNCTNEAKEILEHGKCKLISEFKSLSLADFAFLHPGRRLIQYNKLLGCFALIRYQNHTLIH